MCRYNRTARPYAVAVAISSKVVYNTEARKGRKCSSSVAVAAAGRAAAVLEQLLAFGLGSGPSTLLLTASTLVS